MMSKLNFKPKYFKMIESGDHVGAWTINMVMMGSSCITRTRPDYFSDLLDERQKIIAAGGTIIEIDFDYGSQSSEALVDNGGESGASHRATIVSNQDRAKVFENNAVPPLRNMAASSLLLKLFSRI